MCQPEQLTKNMQTQTINASVQQQVLPLHEEKKANEQNHPAKNESVQKPTRYLEMMEKKSKITAKIKRISVLRQEIERTENTEQLPELQSLMEEVANLTQEVKEQEPTWEPMLIEVPYIPPHENLYAEEKHHKNGEVTMNVAKLSSKTREELYPVQRRQAFHQQIAINHAHDSKKAHSKACKNALSAIHSYANIDLAKASLDTQNKKLIAARKAIKENRESIRQKMDALQKEELEKSAQIDELRETLERTQDASLQSKIEKLENELGDIRKKIGNLEMDESSLHRYEENFKYICDGLLEVSEEEKKKKHKYHENWDKKENFALHESLLTWKNMKDVPLFPHEPSVEDIQQGAVGDCYAQAALCEMVQRNPQKIKECMRDNGDSVTVRFFKKFDTIDDLPDELRTHFEPGDLLQLDDAHLLLQMLYRLGTYKEEDIQDFISIPWIQNSTLGQRFNQLYVQIQKLQKNSDDNKAEIERLEKEYQDMKLLRNEDIAKRVRRITSVFHDTKILSHPREAIEFVQTLSQDEAMQSFLQTHLKTVREYIQQNPKASLDNTLAKFLYGFCDSFSDEQVDEIVERDRKAINQLDTDYVDTKAVYVTVSKDIPTVFGSDYYNRGPLWVHMIQKAYAASGLHVTEKNLYNLAREKAIEKLGKKYAAKNLDDEKKATLNAEIKRMKEEYRYSYEAIASGSSDIFAQELFGEKPQQAEFHAMTPKKYSDFAATITEDMENIVDTMDLSKIEYNPDYSQEQARGMVKNAVAFLMQCYQAHAIMKLAPYLDAKSATYPMTIEEITEELMRFSEWGPQLDAALKKEKKENPTSFNQNLQEHYTDFMNAFKGIAKPGEEELTKKVQEFIQQMLPFITEELEKQSEKYCIQHRIFEKGKDANGREIALYTPMALKYYEKIEDALAHNKPVCVGTKEFIPDDASIRGLNGEALSNGIVEGHAYTVIGCKEIEGHKFVHLRNPWGSFVRGYKLTRTPNPNGGAPIDKYETQKTDNSGKQDGQFLMELNDFMSRIDQIYGISAE